MEHSKHIVRAVLLLVVGLLGFVVVRHFLVPDSFGEVGHFRLESIADFVAQPPAHGAPGACAECHDEEADIVSDGKHATVSCEVCHAPLHTHVEIDPGTEVWGKKAEGGDMPVQPSDVLCAYCHQKLQARRDDFPQVVLREHVAQHGQAWTTDVCKECHDAHNPSE